MKKIPTLLPKDPSDLGRVINGELSVEHITHYAIKIDGTSCLIQDGKPFCRYDAKLFRKKHGKVVQTFTVEELQAKLPAGAIPCQEPDAKSGHYPHWVPVLENNPEHQYIWEGFSKLVNPVDGTYECIGPKVNGNPHEEESHIWIHHQAKELVFKLQDEDYKENAYETFKTLFENFPWEGLVVYNGLDPVAKIRRSDFGYENKGFNPTKTLFE